MFYRRKILNDDSIMKRNENEEYNVSVMKN